MVKNSKLCGCLHLGFVVFLGGVGVTIFSPQTLAQSNIVPDNTLGAESSQITPNYNGFPIEVVTGGATRGINLFHSFQEFNVSAGRGAYFQSPNVAIQNVLARVTGNNPSEILGTLGTFGQSQPNLYLINPNGIVFGRNASLNVGGSFVATTANAIQFPGGAEFSMTSPVTPGNTLLSVNPTAFLFNQIANQDANSIENRGFLQVTDNKSLILLGGRVAPTPESTGQILMDGGRILGFGSRVEIGGLNAPGSVGINTNGDNLSLSFPENIARPDITLVNNFTVFALDEGGNIVVNANNLSLLNNSSFFTGIFNQGNADAKSGDISINATGNVTLAEGSSLGNIALERGNTGDISINANGNITLAEGSSLENIALERGNSGNINIVGKSLNIINGSSIQARATEGNSGAVNITVDDTVSLAGRGINSFDGDLTSSAIMSTVARFDTSPENILGTPTTGTSGGVNIKAQNLSLADGAIISASTTLADDSGDIKIQADDSVILNGAFITSSNFGQGNAGNLFITSDRLILMNNSQILFDTFGTRNAGDINIHSRDINVNNSSIEASVASFPGIISNAGNAGNINIKTERILITNFGFISSSSDLPEQGETFGFAGNININATDLIEIDAKDKIDSITGIIARTLSSSRGGNITLNTKNLILRDGGTISVDAANNLGGDAGNITINASNTVELISSNDNSASSIFTGVSSFDNNVIAVGNGGDIKINTRNLQLTNGIISSASIGNGNAGDIFIFSKDGIIVNDGDIFSDSRNQGNAGNISIISNDDIVINNNGSVRANSLQSGGGNISITARNISLRNNSDIRTDLATGNGRGGNILLTADTIIALEDSDILAFAPEGQGGDITFNARALFSDSLFNPTQTSTDRNSLQALSDNGSSDINASGAISGNIIGVPDVSFIQNGLTELQNNFIDTNTLIANSCIARTSKTEGSFIITGTTGLPTRPSEAMTSSYPTGDVQNVSNSSADSWKKGEPIVEPEGVYRLANGDLVMSRECS